MPGARRRRLRDPLEAGVLFGVPEAGQARCADIIWAPANEIPTLSSFDGLEGDVLMAAKSQLNPPAYSSIGVVNTQRWRSLQLGSTAGHATARGVARIYNGLLEPVRVLRSEEARVGNECASPCISRWSPDHQNNKKYIM